METGVYVLGMHRSGTSAATRLIGLLGPATPARDDLVPVSAKNPTGYWESMSLVAFNTQLLAAVGSDFRWPLSLPPGWERDARLDPLRPAGAAVFRSAFPDDSPWVWKDPRTCLTLAFWRDVLRIDAAAVLVNRNPLEIVASARRSRPADSPTYVLALWERYLRQALAQLTGMRVLVTAYEDVLASPAAWCSRVQAFLRSGGIPADDPPVQEIDGFVDSRLRHSEFSVADLAKSQDASPSQRALFAALQELNGEHRDFVAPELPPETPQTEVLLSERRTAARPPRAHPSWLEGARRLRVRAARLLAG